MRAGSNSGLLAKTPVTCPLAADPSERTVFSQLHDIVPSLLHIPGKDATLEETGKWQGTRDRQMHGPYIV